MSDPSGTGWYLPGPVGLSGPEGHGEREAAGDPQMDDGRRRRLTTNLVPMAVIGTVLGAVLVVVLGLTAGAPVLRRAGQAGPTVAASDPTASRADTPAPSASDAGDPPTAPAAADSDLAISTLRDTRRQLRAFPAEWPIVRGVYSTMWSFAGERWNELMDLVRSTEVNAIVIDVKDDDGRIAWRDSHVSVARETGADRHTNFSRSAAERRIRELRDAGGYPIARIVCFKDPIAAPARPELAIKDAGGGVWRDRKGMAWLDVRFPTDGSTSTAVYDDGKGVDTSRIRDFLAHAREELHAEGVRISADIFGLTTYKAEGEGDGDGTGQLFEDVIAEVDYVSPMVYPSHYYPGNYGLSNPEADPYTVVVNAMREAQERVHGHRAQVRPWLEDFSLTVPHHPGRVSDQMRATYENGIESWLLWNANNRYSRAALAPTETYEAAQPAPPTPTDTPTEAP